jgi:tetratricopeptide (TPR) repeat protein
MSTESLPDNDLRRLAETLPKARLGRKGILTILVAVLVFIAVLSWNWLSASKAILRTQEIRELDGADKKRLEDLASSPKKELINQLARLQLARILLRADGLNKIGTTDSTKQSDAITAIEKARDIYKGLTQDFSKEPAQLFESYVGLGKAEETLSGVKKGSLSDAIEAYKKAVAIAPESEAGKALAKEVATLEKDKDSVQEFYTKLFDSKQLLTPGLPPLGTPSDTQTK